MIAASVWIASAIRAAAAALVEDAVQRGDDAGADRALETERVPIASTVSATCSDELEPRVAGVASVMPCARTTARSSLGSVPTTVPFTERPSLNFTVMLPPVASATTWLLVRITPSALSTTPLPSPPPCWVWTVIETTLGATAAATLASDWVAVPVELLELDEPSDLARSVLDAVVDGWSMWVAMTAPAVPLPSATRATTPAAAVPRTQRRGSRRSAAGA